MMKPPCDGCASRRAGCHNESCEKWRVYSEWKDKERAGRAEQIRKSNIMNEYRAESQKRFLKEKWRKEK